MTNKPNSGTLLVFSYFSKLENTNKLNIICRKRTNSKFSGDDWTHLNENERTEAATLPSRECLPFSSSSSSSSSLWKNEWPQIHVWKNPRVHYWNGNWLLSCGQCAWDVFILWCRCVNIFLNDCGFSAAFECEFPRDRIVCRHF